MFPSEADYQRAVDLLLAGELVGMPTETVYGLGADAANPAAVAKIFAAKGRPADHPLIVHLPGHDAVDQGESVHLYRPLCGPVPGMSGAVIRLRMSRP